MFSGLRNNPAPGHREHGFARDREAEQHHQAAKPGSANQRPTERGFRYARLKALPQFISRTPSIVKLWAEK